MGRPPVGERAMTAAERQRRHRANQAAKVVDTKEFEARVREAVRNAGLPEFEVYKRKLDQEFEQRLREEIGKLLPGGHRAFVTHATYRAILSCLHPDSRAALSEQKLTEAFVAFKRLEPVLVLSEQTEAGEHKREREAHERAAAYARGKREHEERSRRGKAAWAKRAASMAAK
jgi:hypothetical protein